MITSCLLYHGPGALPAVLKKAETMGRLIHEPFGEGGLKVDDARLFVSLMQCPPVGMDHGVLVAGPMDHAAPKSADALLMSIEAPPPFVHPLLWATDLGGVASTIRSRCLDIWCPLLAPLPGDDEIEGVAHELLAAALAGHLWQVPSLVARVKSTSKQRGREPELIAAAVEAMTTRMDDPKVRDLWERVRVIAGWKNPTQIEVISAFLLEHS